MIYRFRQLVFELAWTLLGQRRYQEAADAFMRMVELNSWCVITRIKRICIFSDGGEGVMLPTTSSPQVRPTTGSPYIGPSDCVAGCYIHMGNNKKAQELLDACPALTEKRKLGATKHLPTEVFILKKRKPISFKRCSRDLKLRNTFPAVDFYKEKQRRRTGSEDNYAESIKISTADGESRETFLCHLF